MAPIPCTLVPKHRNALGACAVALLLFASPADAEDAGVDAGRRLADPLTSLDHLSLHFDWDTQIGGFDEGERQSLVAEPAFSFDLGSAGRLVSRTQVPLIRLDSGDAIGVQSGLGDIQQTVYYVPAAGQGESFHWGVGASVRLPSASDDSLGREGVSTGPSVAASWIGRRWTWGAQLQHQSALDRDDPDATLVQPFVAREFASGWSSGVQVDAIYDWERDRLKGPMTLYARRAYANAPGHVRAFDAGFRYWVDGPTEEPEWGVRLGFTWGF